MRLGYPSVALLMLAACGASKESRDATARIENGLLVFDGDRADCIRRAGVTGDSKEGRAGEIYDLIVWNARDYQGCEMRFPFIFGVKPPAAEQGGQIESLEPGERYTFYAQGKLANYQLIFTPYPKDGSIAIASGTDAAIAAAAEWERKQQQPAR